MKKKRKRKCPRPNCLGNIQSRAKTPSQRFYYRAPRVFRRDGKEKFKDSEIVPINIMEINKAIRAFVNTNFANVEYSRNIIWDSYNSFLSPFDKYHHHKFIAQVKVKDVKRLKYLEVYYNPVSKSKLRF